MSAAYSVIGIIGCLGVIVAAAILLSHHRYRQWWDSLSTDQKRAVQYLDPFWREEDDDETP